MSVASRGTRGENQLTARERGPATAYPRRRSSQFGLPVSPRPPTALCCPREVADSAARGPMHNRSASLPAAIARPQGWGRLLMPRYWLTWAGIGVLRLLSLLPFSLQLAIGAALGGVLRQLPLRFVRIA